MRPIALHATCWSAVLLTAMAFGTPLKSLGAPWHSFKESLTPKPKPWSMTLSVRPMVGLQHQRITLISKTSHWGHSYDHCLLIDPEPGSGISFGGLDCHPADYTSRQASWVLHEVGDYKVWAELRDGNKVLVTSNVVQVLIREEDAPGR